MAEQKTSAEIRQHARAPIELKVDYKKLNSFFADYTKNISKGGTFIKTKKPLPIGTRFLFKLTVPQREAPFELLGEVVWSKGDVEEPGMGIRFIYNDDRQRGDFEGVVERLMADSLGTQLTEKLLNKQLHPG
ncbi:TIGR02266 family protein [Archangium lansingense]|uniref:TIGR02266 family protein n=2 Tax=Archangium lansingense TaxID=2995310 RepID=A0ABT4A4X8_9BACT|nr:TIGR02266 family protein [Archangium lansinium]